MHYKMIAAIADATHLSLIVAIQAHSTALPLANISAYRLRVHGVNKTAAPQRMQMLYRGAFRMLSGCALVARSACTHAR
jgi:hypothetical protein